MDILDLLRSDGSIIVNKKLANKIGLNEAVILSELIARFKWHEEKEEDQDGWFYCTTDTLENQTSLNRYYQDKAIDNLQELDLITKKTKGIPAKRYFKINTKQVVNIVTSKIVKDSQTCSSNSNKQESDSVTRSNTQDNCLVNNKHNNKPSDNSDTESGDKFSLKGQTDGGYYIYPDEYEKIYELYPANNGSKKAGWRKWAATRRKGVSKEDLIKAVKNYAKVCEREDRDKKYVKHIGTFFGPDEHWREYLELNEESINVRKLSDKQKEEIQQFMGG